MMKNLLTLTFTLLTTIYSFGQNALDFDGSNDQVQTPYGGVFGTSARTFEAWVYHNSGATSNECILDYGLNAVGSRNTFGVNASGALVYLSGGTNANISSSINAVPTNQWVHVAFVLNSGVGYLYVNGVQVGTGNLSTVNTPTGNTNVRIGNRVPGGSIPFDGRIDEVKIWDIARTPAQIIADMNAEYCTIPTNLKAYYKFNQGTAGGSNTGLTTLLDNSGNGNNGTLSGFSLSGTGSNWVTGATLTQGTLTGGIDTVSNCIPFTTPGNQVLTASGTYPDTVVSSTGCDSIYTIDFTALANSQSQMTASACNFYVSPAGNVYNTTGTHYDTLVNAVGCDSIIEINLTINSTSLTNISPTACQSYTSPAGNVYTVSGTYVDTFQNAAGCDSLIAINLTILNNTQVTLNDTACNSYTSPSGQVWTTSGTYNDTVVGGAGCDSIFTINLVINQSVTSTVNVDNCGDYTSDLGNTYTTSGTYTEVTQSSTGCDSTITLNVTISSLDLNVTQSGNTLTADQANATYQWIDCSDISEISGETGQSFTATVSGDYAVIITNGSCMDTTACVTLTNVGINEVMNLSFEVFPNPANDYVTISTDQEIISNIRILDLVGKELLQVNGNGSNLQTISISDLPSGIYFIHLNNQKGLYKVLKE